MNLEYEFHNYNRVSNQLRALATQNKAVTDKSMGTWTKSMRAYAKGYGYPGQTNNPQPFKTERSRRWFFWALNSGLITVPYQRTGRLANSWRAERRGMSDWLLANSADYAGWVVGEDQQARYHQGNWWVIETLIRQRTPELTKLIATDLMKLFASGGSI